MKEGFLKCCEETSFSLAREGWPEDHSRSLLNFKMFLINIAYRVVAYKNYVLNQSRLFQIFSNLELSN